jgi:hypothetical protein
MLGPEQVPTRQERSTSTGMAEADLVNCVINSPTCVTLPTALYEFPSFSAYLVAISLNFTRRLMMRLEVQVTAQAQMDQLHFKEVD